MEHELQVSCVRWFKDNFSDKLIWATPNGGLRAKHTARMLKAEGELSGVPDLQIPEPMGAYHGLFIEMKYGKNKTSTNQKMLISELEKRGYFCAVCYSKEEFEKAVCDYFGVDIPNETERERSVLFSYINRHE